MYTVKVMIYQTSSSSSSSQDVFCQSYDLSDIIIIHLVNMYTVKVMIYQTSSSSPSSQHVYCQSL